MRSVSLSLMTVAIVVMSSCLTNANGGEPGATLQSVLFPDPAALNPEPEGLPPAEAPSTQRLVLTFDRPPTDADRTRVQILDRRGRSVAGNYEVDGNQVSFTPRLPRRLINPRDPLDNGAAGLRRDRRYVLRVGPSTWPEFVAQVDPDLLRDFADPDDALTLRMEFGTTGDPDRFLQGWPSVTPRLTSVVPRDGATGVTPQLFTDPSGLFAPRAPFLMRFDQPVHPDPDNLQSIRLVDADESFLPLDVLVRVKRNSSRGSIVEVEPAGILPFGHLLLLEFPGDLRGLGQSSTPTGPAMVASVFRIDTAPGLVSDRLVESFDGRAQDSSDSPAEWNLEGSGYLQARSIPATGELGRFVPFAPFNPSNPTVVSLNTDAQAFPLSDGSTPDAPSVTVRGGIFQFLDVSIPEGVLVRAEGSNPLVFMTTGSVRIAGAIEGSEAVGDSPTSAGALHIDSQGLVEISRGGSLRSVRGADAVGDCPGALSDREGGVIDLASGASIVVDDNTRLDVEGEGGEGGLVKLRTPRGTVAEVHPDAEITEGAWVDPQNLFLPAPMVPISSAVSRWYDHGRTVSRIPVGTRPAFRFRGTDADGFVRTDAEGNVIDPSSASFRVLYPGQRDPENPAQFLPGEEPRRDFVPTNSTVRIQFQGADAIRPGSGQVDPATMTDWVASASLLSGHQFLRFRVTFDISANGQGPSLRSRRPAVTELWIDVEL